jgi:hypothetical protein
MAMVKIVSPSGWDFDGPVASLVKMASGRLRGHDRRQFIKRASGSANVFLPYLDTVKIAADEEPVHLIALGASEAYGPNRNGDAFREAVCKKYHDTFVKFARFYRNHKNKDPNISYGQVRLSAYNPDMRRVELLVALNREKSAAERNGGRVADRELEKLARGDDIPVSMACRVPYDVCSECGNRARSREEYCTSASCKGGGCAENLTRLVKHGNDARILYVDNDEPHWFDISAVFRPADRIAYGGKADYLTKSAADLLPGYRGGAQLADDLGVLAPLDVVLAQDGPWADRRALFLAGQVKLAHGLADLEDQVGAASDPADAAARYAFTTSVQPDFDLDAIGLGDNDNVKMAAALGALADQKIILPLRDFARLTKRAALASAAAVRLPGVYRRMIADGSLERRLSRNRYAPGEKLASASQRRYAERVRCLYSLEKNAVFQRAQRAALRQGAAAAPARTAAADHDDQAAEELARDYAVYKVAALQRIAGSDDDFLLTARLSCCQNQAR